MTNSAHAFVEQRESKMYSFFGSDIDLELDPKVFPPSVHTLFFVGDLDIKSGERVLDVGCGSGLLAIVAAKMGGEVCATDIDAHATASTMRNAKRNGVHIDARTGDLFESFIGEKFDVIIANLPQEIVHEDHRRHIGECLYRTVDGGVDGNTHMIRLFQEAWKYMHENSRLVVSVGTLTDYMTTIREMLKMYDVLLKNVCTESTKDFVDEHEKWYRSMADIGKISFFREGDEWKTFEYLFELKKKLICR